MKTRLLCSVGIHVAFLVILTFGQTSRAMTIKLTPAGRAVVVWAQDQTISGTVSGPVSPDGILYVNGVPRSFVVSDTVFSVPIRIGEGTTTIVARVDSSGVPAYSDTLALTLGYDLRPEIYPYALVAGSNVSLHASVLENPDSALLSFRWSARSTNPSRVTLQNISDSLASFTLTPGMAPGEYLFDVTAISSRGDTVRPATMVTLDSAGHARAFEILKGHARWIDSAIVYSIAPHDFFPDGNFADIIAQIPDLADLGITTIWLLPIYPTTEPTFGYHVMDYFKIRTDFGTEEDLHNLVKAAHARGMRVMMDFVPNHTTIYHPYAQDAITYGPRSHYYDFYSHTGPGSVKIIGLMQFTIYFYPELVNLNFDNPELARMIEEAGRYWIEKFDIDGYRLDMVWAVDQRFPESMRTWSMAMKRWKPDVFLLAESFADTSRNDYVLPKDGRYDAAYDWVSLGAIALPGIFDGNAPGDGMRAYAKEMAVPGGKVVRMLENSDKPRFISKHTMSQLQTAAALLFTLHGIPHLYMGQEIGFAIHPYDGVPTFERGMTIHEQDRLGLWPFYQALARLRTEHPLFSSDNYESLNASPSATTFGYHRWQGDRHAFCVLNMKASSGPATVNIIADSLHLDESRTYYLTDAVSGEIYPVKSTDLSSLTLNYAPWSARVLLMDTVASITGLPGVNRDAELPASIALRQNYPNPFNPTTAIEYSLPFQTSVSLKVLDVLGRVVVTLIEGECTPGWHTVFFDGTGRASGLYFSVLRAGGRTEIKKMLLLK